MEVVDVEPSAVLPLTASARAAIARALGLSHLAAALRHITCFARMAASRPARAVLGDVTGQSCVISPPVPPLVQGGPRGG